MKRTGILLALIIVTGCGRRAQRPSEVATPSVDLSGTYILDVTASTDFKTFAHSYIFLNGADPGHPITISQADGHAQVVFTTRWHGKHTNMLESIGASRSPWSWTTNGLTCTARWSKLFNFYMLPGAVHRDQTCTITQEHDGTLLVERSSTEGGRMFWLLPWKDDPWTSTLTLRRQERGRHNIILESTESRASTASSAP